ncbi:MAG: transglycosylase domain-containing protein, partial [Mailhella sp.]|nr:transglycosylase domain-containing protein [Mailhella sp.]
MSDNWNDIERLELGPADKKHGVDAPSPVSGDAAGEAPLAFGKGGSSSPKPVKKKHGLFRTFFKIVFALFLLGVIAAARGGYVVYRWATADLPSFSRIADYRPPLVTTVLARDGSYLGQLYHERRFLVTLDQLPSFIPKAFLAIEDDQFYEHPGVSLKAILRAALANFNKGTATQGGSTITQQVVKRLMLTPEKSYERKLKEAILAYRLEKQLSKDDILTLYINQIFLGSNSYGVEAAARTYFSKHAKELSIAEAALIAGLGQSPSAFNPYRNPNAARNRQQQVLRRMRDLGWISDGEYDQAVSQKLVFKPMTVSNGDGGWYFEEVRRQLIEMFSEENCKKNGYDFGIYGEDAVYELGLTVHTAMDPFQQAAATAGLRHGLEDATRRHGWLGAPEHLEPSQYADFLKKKNFKLSELDGMGQKVLFCIWNSVALLLSSLSLCVVSLNFAIGRFDIFYIYLGYLRIPEILLLNWLPLLLLQIFLFAVLNRQWLAFFVTATIGLAMSIGNYFKLIFRADPFTFNDLSSVQAGLTVAGNYDIRIDWRILLAILFVILTSLILFFFA